MNLLASIPVVAPLGMALLALIFPRPSAARRASVALGLLALLGFSVWLLAAVQDAGPLVLSWGGWVVPYGIVLVADTLAAIMLCLSCLTAFACALYGFVETSQRDEHPLRLPLLSLLLAGIHLAFLTGDLFNLFVAFEVFLLASYALMTLEVDARRSRQALPYVLINLLGSALFLCVCAFAYGLLGTLNFAEMVVRGSSMAGDARLTLLGVLLIIVFALKAGLFPLYYWLPVSYPALPAAIAAFYAGMLTKVGVYVLIRTLGTVLPPDLTLLHSVVAWAAGLTMLIGVLGAVAQNRIQSILSYHIVSQVGYMALAVGFFSTAAFAAAIFYVIHHIVVKAALFLVGGIIQLQQGTDDTKETGGLWVAAPGLGIVFIAQALSLAGIPPLSGFWGKLMIIREGALQGRWVLVIISLIASILTLLSMLKIWLGAFWQARPEGARGSAPNAGRMMTVVVAGLVAVSLWIGVGASFFIEIASHAAAETLDRAEYVSRVRALNQDPEEGKHP